MIFSLIESPAFWNKDTKKESTHQEFLGIFFLVLQCIVIVICLVPIPQLLTALRILFGVEEDPEEEYPEILSPRKTK